MNNIFRHFIAILGITALLSSCNDDNIIPDSPSIIEGREATVSLSLQTLNPVGNLNTRSIPDGLVDEGENNAGYIKDVYLIEYVNKPDGMMIGIPRYFSGAEELASLSSLTLNLPKTSDVEYVLIAIANTHDPELKKDLMSFDNLAKFCNYNKGFVSEKQAYQTNIDSSHDLLLNGYAIINNNTSHIDLELERNIVKIDFNIKTMKNSGIILKSVQLKNVPNAITYANSYFSESGMGYANNCMFYEFPKEDIDEASLESDADGDILHISYLIPQNCQGTNDSPDAKNKNYRAPAHATYLEIMAAKADGSTLRYRFYPGENMTNDFNLKANHHYTLPITILNAGDPDVDSRVEVFDKINLLEDANSFIINYIGGNQDSQPSYRIPIKRANYYWQKMNDYDFMIDTDTEWVAEVIWQDSAEDLFYFCDTDGNKIDSHFLTGKGNGYFTIQPKVGKNGNVLIGLRKKDFNGDVEGYSWSWHLWITDYNPTYKSAAEEGKSLYPVDGGAVHRYGGDYWKEKLPGNFIMDRNFGAHAADPSSGDNVVGLYYVFGRKDPVVYGTVYKYYVDNGIEILRNPKSNEPKLFIVAGQQVNNLENIVKHPNHFYGNSNAIQWYTGATNDGWLRESWQPADERSIYDPCPIGWRIPSASEYNYQNYITYCKDGAGVGIYFYLDNENMTDDNVGYMAPTSLLFPNTSIIYHSNYAKNAYLMTNTVTSTTLKGYSVNIKLDSRPLLVSTDFAHPGWFYNMRLISDTK